MDALLTDLGIQILQRTFAPFIVQELNGAIPIENTGGFGAIQSCELHGRIGNQFLVGGVNPLQLVLETCVQVHQIRGVDLTIPMAASVHHVLTLSPDLGQVEVVPRVRRHERAQIGNPLLFLGLLGSKQLFNVYLGSKRLRLALWLDRGFPSMERSEVSIDRQLSLKSVPSLEHRIV